MKVAVRFTGVEKGGKATCSPERRRSEEAVFNGGSREASPEESTPGANSQRRWWRLMSENRVSKMRGEGGVRRRTSREKRDKGSPVEEAEELAGLGGEPPTVWFGEARKRSTDAWSLVDVGGFRFHEETKVRLGF